jgi:hypothetical protein
MAVSEGGDGVAHWNAGPGDGKQAIAPAAAPQRSRGGTDLMQVKAGARRRRDAGAIPGTRGRPDVDAAIRHKILELLDTHRTMTVATLRPDGWPQATMVGYVNEGLVLYFLCGLDSQKAANLARDDRVSITIGEDTDDILQITGLSMAAHATPVLDREEAGRILALLPSRYPEQAVPLPMPMPTAEQVRIMRVDPTVISVLDYTQGFGHADLVAC